MTLLEAIAALIIVGLSAVGWIGLAQGTTRSATDAAQWEAVVATAESTMEEALVSARSGGIRPARVELPRGVGEGLETQGRTQVQMRPWSAGVTDVVVTVTLPDGGAFELHRLVRDTVP